MKRFITLFMAIFVAMFVVCSPVMVDAAPEPVKTEQALKVEVDLSQMPDNVRNTIINAMNANNSQDTDIVARVLKNPSEMTGYMHEFAVGVQEVCDVLSVEVNEFVTTPVGIMATSMVIYKVMDGKEVLEYFKELVTMLPFVIIGWVILFKYIRRVTLGYNRKTPILDENGKKTGKCSYTFEKPTWSKMNSDEQGAVSVVFVLCALVLLITTGIAIL